MNLTDLTEFIVKNLVTEPDYVSVREIDSEDCLLIEVLVAEIDKGKVIGKGGSIANAIRTIIQASSYANKNKSVRINIDSM